MIPLARMLKYGNVADDAYNIKLYSSTFGAYIHDLDTLKLYASSYTAHSSGTGVIETSFVESASDVKKVWLQDNSSGLMIIELTNGTFWATGQNTAITGTANTYYNTWTNISTLFSAAGLSGENMAYMSSYYNLKINVVTNDGSLYCCGKNNTSTLSSFGNGTNTDSFNAFIRISTASSIKKAVGNYYLKTDGTLYCTGTNVNYQYGNGNTTSLNTLVQVQSNIQDINAGYQNLYTLDNGGVLRGNGRQFGAAYGNEFGTGGTSASTAVVYTTPVIMASNISKLFVCVNNMATHIVQDGSLLSTGNNSLGQLSVGNQLPVYTYTRSYDFNTSSQLVRTTIGSLLFHNNKLYYSGRNDMAVGGSSTSYSVTFTEVLLSFL